MVRRGVILVVIASLLVAVSALAQSDAYRIGPDDVLEVRFWQDASLNSNVRVSNDGYIALDIIGRIQAAGLTAEELQGTIVRQMSRLNSQISQAVVRVLEYNHQHVFVKGQVAAPGKYTFERIPDLWTIINEAGGLTEFGDLSRVTIIGGEPDSTKVQIVDVMAAIERSDFSGLPQVTREATIEIPRSPLGLPSPEITSRIEQRNVFYVVGAVNSPGQKSFEEDIDIMEAIALAGGPLANADLKHARVITKDGSYAQTIEVNLVKYSKTGIPARYLLNKEDLIYLPERQDAFLGIGLGTAAAVLGVLTSAVLIYDQLSE